ncbi:hypothetical protein BDP27DRAFT_1047442 [Rhodocollybia butyracea]|uniref:F-box domain-containing protein n=1 Tax=Rhodocollybia butyracea TaxID=206335 RepID=A0A9P5U523_9AGAR|nr:hypothetical protein BDP27DRAFT_1047442 [Rhodocollybia butyracea]
MPFSHAVGYYLGLAQIEWPVNLTHSDISCLQTSLSEFEVLLAQTHHIDQMLMQMTGSKSPEIAAKIDGWMQQLSTVIAMHRNILSPIRRVPLEILSLIFELVCLTNYIEYDPGYILAVGGACKAWRNALYATPRVWSRLYLDIRSHWRILLDDDAPSVKQWFSRSLGMPLDIELVLTTQVVDDDPESRFASSWPPVVNIALMHKARCVIDSLVEFSPQIRSIEITASAEMFALLTCFNELEFPLLETISLTIVIESIQAFGPYVPLTLLKAPKLRDVRVVEPANAFRPVLDDFHVPLAQLTSLRLDLRKMDGVSEGLPLNGFVEVLSECRNLITLEILIGEYHSVFRSLPNLSSSLPHLRSLELSYNKVIWEASNSLLQYITAPKLEHLALRCDAPYCYIADASDLVDFQVRSSITLRSLELVDFPISDNEVFSSRVLPILAACPSVRSFGMRLDEFVRLAVLIKAMTYTRGQPLILPYITHLVLRATDSIYGLDWECPSEIVPMILSRIRGEEETDGKVVARLQKVVLTEVESTDEIREIREIYDIPDLDVHMEFI